MMNRKVSTLYPTLLSGCILLYTSNLGGNADYLRPIIIWDGVFLFFIISNYYIFYLGGRIC